MEYTSRGVAICHKCGKQCKSVPGLNRHMGLYVDSITNLSAQSNFSCAYCGLECKLLAGKRSHMSAKHKYSQNTKDGHIIYAIAILDYLIASLQPPYI